MVTYIPVSTIGEGPGLNITVHGYSTTRVRPRLLRELVPDLCT